MSTEDKQLLTDLPIDDIDALIETDYDGLVEARNKSNPNLTEKQQSRRLEMINKIIDLHTWAVIEKESKKHSWAWTDNARESSKSSTSKSRGKNKNHDKKLREFPTYKFSQMGQSELQEAVILDGSPKFITYDSENEQFKSVDKIKQQTRILIPPSYEEYPYTPYEFTDENLYDYIRRAKAENVESLYRLALSLVKQYNAQDEHKLILIAMGVVWSYFQDKFGTTHYVGIVGDNGSGKSTAGNTFEALAYRCVNETNPSPANVFRILGVVEPGQCTLVLDESRNIDQSPDMISILNTGYEYLKKVPKINTIVYKQEFYFTYGLKVIIGETSINQFKARGVFDRTLQFTTYPSKPLYDIKEIVSPQGNPIRIRELHRLMDFRKLMLVYRLIHFKDPITEVDVGIEGRNKELCKPYIQLFYGTSIQQEIEDTLQKFINVKNEKKSVSLEYVIVPIILDLIQKEGKNEILVSKVWGEIVSTLGAISSIDINGKEHYPDEYHTSEYGTFYKNSVVKLIYDKFAEHIRIGHESARGMRFDIDKLQMLIRSYDRVKIKTTLPNNGLENANNADSADSSSGSVVCNLVEKNEFVGSADILTDTNNNGININITNNISSSSRNYNSQSVTKDKDADSMSESAVPAVGTVGTINARINQPQTRNACKIRRIGHSDRFECEDCRLKDDIHFMKIHLCKDFKPAYLHEEG
ncbi:MAG TPA: hypothetical protein VH500_12165 [Nitrososphaeraceae archaeon]